MIEKHIATAALQQAKVILDNKDFWGGPSAAKTSADTVHSLISIATVLGGIPSGLPSPPPTEEVALEKPAKAEKEETKKADAKSESTKP